VSDPASIRDIDVTGLGKRYGAVHVLHDVSFTLRDGEFLTLLGPSGSGKTTTLGIIAGFVDPDYGDVRVGDRSIVGLPPRHRNLGIVFQNYALFPHLCVADNVAFGLRMRNVPRAERERRSKRMLERVGMGEFGERMPAQLSGGQQQRVALARALIIDPAALLLDEPLGALDRRLRQQVEIELKSIQRETGVSVLHVTHDQEEAMVMSDRIAVMRAGHIEQIDTPTNVYKYPSTRFVADFLGEANLFDVNVSENDGSRAVVTYADGSSGAVHVSSARGAGGSGNRGTVCVRPERIHFAVDDDAAENAVYGTFASYLHLGATLRCIVQVLGQELIVTRPDHAGFTPPEPGARVRLVWGAADGQLLANES
jgi:ABC-type Fe3+/spermidine/putrescine transport system ATPase subunit